MQLPGGRPVAKTDADGRARIDVSAGAGQAYMSVSPPGDRPLLPLSRLQPLDAGADTVVLAAAADITGTVLDVDGEPLPRAVVCARWGERGMTLVPSDAAGRFRIRVRADARVELTLTGQVLKEHRAIEGRLVDVVAGSGDVVLRARTIDADRTLRVKVVGPDGVPIEGIGITLLKAETKYDLTDSRGIAEFTGLLARTLVVAALAPQRHDAFERWAAPERVTTVPNGQQVVLRFREAVVVSGTVLLPDGAPAYVVVVARDEKGDLVTNTGTSREDGTFCLRIPKDHAGTVTVEIRPGTTHVDPIYQKLADVRIPGVAPGTEGLEIRLERR
jgi:hypothetical protein